MRMTMGLGLNEIAAAGPALWTPAALSSSLKTGGVWWDMSQSAYLTQSGGLVTGITDRFGANNAVQTTASLQGTFDTDHVMLTYGGYQPATAHAPLWGILLTTYAADGTLTTYEQWPTFWGLSSGSAGRVQGKRNYNTLNTDVTYFGGTARKNGASALSAAMLPLSKASVSWTLTSGLASGLYGIGLAGDTISRYYGSVYEVIALATEPDTATRQRLEGYLHWRHGAAASLPTDHPYKSAAPRLQ